MNTSEKLFQHSYYRWIPAIMVLLFLGIVIGAGSTGNQTKISHFVTPKPAEGFILLCTGQWQGHLEPCGCAEKQLGGIDRRSKTLQAIAGDVKNRLLLDRGPLVENEHRQDQLKLETFLYSMKQLNYDGLCLTPLELKLLRENLSVEPTDRPPLICTNMETETRKKFSTVEYLEKTITYQDKKLKCLVMGVSLAGKTPPHDSFKNLKLLDPLSSIKRVLTQKSIDPDKPSDDLLVVVLLAGQSNGLDRQLQKIAALDVLVTEGFTDEPEACPINGTGPLTITTGKMGKYITRLDITPEQINNNSRFKFQTEQIDSDFPRDQAIVSLIDDYQLAMQIENIIADDNALVRSGLEDGNRFAGNASCGNGSECHQDIYQTWLGYGHARAMATLQNPDVNRQFDPECVSCHTVGMRHEGGYRSMDTTPELANVGCEMCHGPGANHIEYPSEEYQNVFTACEDCHNSETSPSFDLKRQEYFQKIKHWKDSRKYWD